MTSTCFTGVISLVDADGDLFRVNAGSIQVIARRSRYDSAARANLNEGDTVTVRCDNGVNYVVSKT